MERVFHREGTPVEVAGNRPLLLSGGDWVWMVRSGELEVFAVKMENGTPAGARMHLCSIPAGNLLFGVGGGKHGSGIGLIAVGPPGALALRLDLARFMSHAADPESAEALDGLISSWVTLLSVAVRTQVLPKTWVRLGPGAEISVATGQKARPEAGVVWVRQEEGASRFMDRMDLDSMDADEGTAFPLSSQAWLHAVLDGRLSCRDTWSTFRDDPHLRGLERFHRVILDCAASSMERAEAEGVQRLRSREARDRLVFDNALAGLSGLMAPKGHAALFGEDSDDALLSVSRVIGSRLAIPIRAPAVGTGAGRDPLDAIARASRVRTRRVLLKDGWYRRDCGPLLGFTSDGNRPVALLPSSVRSYTLHDPAARTRKEVTQEVAESLEDHAYTFYRSLPARALGVLDIITFGLRGSSRDLWAFFAVAVTGSLLGLVPPIATGIIVSTVIPNSQIGHLGQIALVLVACTLAYFMFELTRSAAVVRIGSKMDASVQAGVMDRLLSLPAPFFRAYATGDLVDRTLGINAMRQIALDVTIRVFMGGIFACCNFLLLFYYDVKLAVIAAVMALIHIGFTCTASYGDLKLQRIVSRIQGSISGLILQFATGMTRLRLSGAEDRAFSLWAGEFTEQKTISSYSARIRRVLSTFNSAFPILALMAIFAWAVLSSERPINVGDFSAFSMSYALFQTALLQMSDAFMASLKIIPLYERSRPILRAIPETEAGKASPEELTGDIEINHLSFRYDSDGPLALEDVSLRIRPGEFVALVGSSGSGKSTLLRLLLGFESQESGSIYYDGQELSTLNIIEVRRQMGVVLQNARVMAGSIFRNIVGASTLTLEEAWEAARMAGFDEDIRQMPMGMHTEMTAGGGTLSGGQRQRLLIARALARKPRILFFDEATSSLDNLTQEVVSHSLDRLQATRVVIAHRLSTILMADKVYVMDRGRIVQSGSYQELMNQEGLFAELAKRQIA